MCRERTIVTRGPGAAACLSAALLLLFLVKETGESALYLCLPTYTTGMREKDSSSPFCLSALRDVFVTFGEFAVCVDSFRLFPPRLVTSSDV